MLFLASEMEGVAVGLDPAAFVTHRTFIGCCLEEYFSTGFGANPQIGVWFDHEDWYFFSPDDLYETSGGNFRVKKETAIADGADFDELTRHSVQTKLDELAGGE